MPTSLQSNGSGDNEDLDRSLRGRLSRRFLKPVDPSAPHAEVAPAPSLEELDRAKGTMNDVERLIGLIMAPLTAVVALVLISQYVTNWKNKHPGKHNVPSIYSELFVVFLVLAVIIMVLAWLRKRLFLGMAVSLVGLSIFSLSYKWLPIAVPFVLVGAWYLVRAYRAQQAWKAAGGQVTRAGGSSRASDAGPSAPRPSKRYTPPTARPKRALPNPEDG